MTIGIIGFVSIFGLNIVKSLKINAFDRIILILILYTIIRYVVQKDFYILNEKFLLTIGLTIFYFLIRITKPKINYIYNFVIILFSFNILSGTIETYGLFRGSYFSWSSENSAIYSIYIASLMPIVTYKAYKTSSTSIRLLILSLILAGILLLYKLESRTAWIASIVSIGFMGLYMTNWFRGRKLILLSSLVIIMVFLLSLALYSYKKNSADGRLFIYDNTWEMICDAPLFGHGFDTFKVKYLEYQKTYFSEHKDDTQNILLADNTRTAFNDYILIWAEQGIFAIFMLLAALFWIVRHLSNNNIAFCSGICVFAISSLFSYPIYSAPCGLTAILFIGTIANSEDLSTVPKPARHLVIGISCACLMLLSMSNLILYSLWNDAYKKVLVFDYSGFLTYNKITPLMYGNGGYLFNYGSELLFAGNIQNSETVLNAAKTYFNDNLLYMYLGDTYSKQQSYSLAEDHYIQAINMVPNRLYPRYRLLQLYEMSGQENMAQSLAKEILQCKVKIPSNTIDMIRNYAKETLNK